MLLIVICCEFSITRTHTHKKSIFICVNVLIYNLKETVTEVHVEWALHFGIKMVKNYHTFDA